MVCFGTFPRFVVFSDFNFKGYTKICIRWLSVWYENKYRSILQLQILQDVVIRSEEETIGLQCIYSIPVAIEGRKNIPTSCLRIKVRFMFFSQG